MTISTICNYNQCRHLATMTYIIFVHGIYFLSEPLTLECLGKKALAKHLCQLFQAILRTLDLSSKGRTPFINKKTSLHPVFWPHNSNIHLLNLFPPRSPGEHWKDGNVLVEDTKMKVAGAASSQEQLWPSPPGKRSKSSGSVKSSISWFTEPGSPSGKLSREGDVGRNLNIISLRAC